jgi:hypothetical protein
MGRKNDFEKLSDNYEFDSDDQEDEEHLIEFKNSLFNGLLCITKKVAFDRIINTELIADGMLFNAVTEIDSVDWFYTADRLMINNRRIYSFRFPNPCHPDFYESFVPYYHTYFARTNQTRHGLSGWYKYIEDTLPEMIRNYLKIAKVMNAKKSYTPMIFVNDKYERLDIEFDLKSDDGYERVTITFERGSPAT